MRSAGRALARVAGWGLVGAWTAVCTLAVAPRLWGLVLAVAATAAAVLALRGGSRRLGFALGYVAVVAAVLPERPEGDLVLGADGRGWTVLVTAFLVLATGVATLPRPARDRSGQPPPT